MVDDGEIVERRSDYNNTWWGVTALASFKLSDEIHAELAAGYKNREGDDFDATDDSARRRLIGRPMASSTRPMASWRPLLHPVDQLTIGVEGEWYTTDDRRASMRRTADTSTTEDRHRARRRETFSVDLVSVWRF